MGSPTATCCLATSSATRRARVAAKAAHSGRALSSSNPSAYTPCRGSEAKHYHVSSQSWKAKLLSEPVLC